MRRLPRPVFHALTLALLAVGCASPPPACTEASFAAYWSAFQSASVAGNVPAIQQRAGFPLATRGPMDGDPVTEHNAEQFPALWSQLLEQDPGLRLEPETMREYIARHDTAPADAVAGDGMEARVADLVFTCRAGAWALTMAYTTE